MSPKKERMLQRTGNGQNVEENWFSLSIQFFNSSKIERMRFQIHYTQRRLHPVVASKICKLLQGFVAIRQQSCFSRTIFFATKARRHKGCTKVAYLLILTSPLYFSQLPQYPPQILEVSQRPY